MIERYTLPRMGRVWSEENKLQKWLEVELAALEGLARYGYVPKAAVARVRRRARFDAGAMRKIEARVKHDVIAFLTDVAKKAGADSRYIHFGLTSSDILDTALALQIKEASQILSGDLIRVLGCLAKRARQHRTTVMAGRTHGVHAEPTTLGFKLAVFFEEFQRNVQRLEQATDQVACGKISGAVGTYANIDPRVEAYVCRKLALKADPISTQVVQRDRHAHYLTILAVIGGSLEKLATEVRGLQRTETREVEEFFGEGQKGSSAMPHKRNPITCERVTGLARLLRGNAVASLENIALWHERDITHSSVERVIFPDSTILLDYMLVMMADVIEHMVVHKEAMLENLERSRGLVFSQGFLLKLIQKGISREEAYAMVQRACKAVWQDATLTLKDAVLRDAAVHRCLAKREIDEVFNYAYHTKHVNTVFRRIGL